MCLSKPRAEKSRDYRDVIVLAKLRFQNVFRPHENAKPAFTNSSGYSRAFSKSSVQNVFRPHENAKLAFSNCSGLKNVFEKLCFRDRLVWTVGLTVEIKLRFQISTA